MYRIIVLATALLLGCTSAKDTGAPADVPRDSDGDGHTDAAENDAGTDPEDGFSWPTGPCSWPDFRDEAADDGVVGTGWGFDEIMPSFETIDQCGDPFDLYRYYGFVVLIDISAGWCVPCRALAEDIEAHYQSDRAKGFTVLYVMIDGDIQDEGTTDAFLNEWVDQYGISFPVTREQARGDVTTPLRTARTMQDGIPNLILLDRDMRIDMAQAGAPEPEFLNRIEVLLAE